MTQLEREWQLWDKAFGWVSGIPNCCVEYYVGPWLGGEVNTTPYPRPWNSDYVLCPQCQRDPLVHRRTIKCEPPFPPPSDERPKRVAIAPTIC